MPFKSEAQRRKFAELKEQGKISGATFEEWNKATGKEKLPERVKPKGSVNPTFQSVEDIKNLYKKRG